MCKHILSQKACNVVKVFSETDSGRFLQKKHVRRPGIEPGSTAWKATMLTFTPPTLVEITLTYVSPVVSKCACEVNRGKLI